MLWQGDEVLGEQTLNNNVDEINQGRGNLHSCMFFTVAFCTSEESKTFD